MSGDLFGKLPAVQGSLNLSIGGALKPASGKGGRGLNGDMDEVRLRKGVPSDDRVKAEYDTVADAAFVVVAPPEDLTILWANRTGATPGLSGTAYNAATFAGTILDAGEDGACDVLCKVWPADAAEPEDWTTLASGLASGGSFSAAIGLSPETAYAYVLKAVNGHEETGAVSGTFATPRELVVDWADASGTAGFSRLSHDFAVVGGEIAALGGSAECDVLGKVWADGDDEPAEWTLLEPGLRLGESFNSVFSGLEPGTSYRYALRAAGDNGEGLDSVSGAFGTLGSPGEEIGSPYTHFFEDGTNACWVANDFERYLQFTVTGYSGTEVLTNFPVLVDVRKNDKNGFSYDDFYHYDGRDMAFVDGTGHIIPHEIDTWNKNGMSLVWVRLPEMRNGTEFTMCYRSPLVDPPPDPGNVFERYVGVWHMNEPDDGVVELKDSTTNNLAGETHAQSLAGINAGQMIGGNARRVAQMHGSSSSYGRIIVFDKDDKIRTGVGNAFTYSGWYKTADAEPKWAYLAARKSEDVNDGWGVQYNDNSAAALRVWTQPKTKSDYQTFAVTGYKHAEWAYWTFVFSNQTFHAFLNGEELDSTKGGFGLNQPVCNDENAFFDSLCIGGQQSGTGAFNGWVDEARYSKGVRSDDWIRAEYDSTRQKDVPFVTKGSQVGRGVDSLVPVVVWERGDGLPDTILDVSYAYVQFAGTVTYCGAGADECRIEYRLWPDGEPQPETWTTLAGRLTAGTSFSIPVTGLKQDMLYNFVIRAVNVVDGKEQQNHEHGGSFRTTGNVTLGDIDGELLRIGDKFVHRFRTGHWRFRTPDYATNVEIMVVGGGGAGGFKMGGGGGGGGVFHDAAYPVTTNTDYRINVGKGGTAPSDAATESAKGNGEWSYFALAGDESNPLILVPGGGGGGSFSGDPVSAAVAAGADGASGGGGTCALAGGAATEGGAYGHAGGRGNDAFNGGAVGQTAAGGGGGAGRAGLQATFDQWSAGGAGGVGVENSMTGEQLFYGAGGGGGYAYRWEVSKDGSLNYTKPGGGGSGIGGDAANVRDGTPATSGVENTGAGGGGGSMVWEGTSDESLWQGGNGGDGVVLISYEAHGRDPVSDEPRITMRSCDYTDEKGYADILYRAYWAGIQAQTNDIYVLYSTAGYDDVAAGGGELVKAVTDTIGIGGTTFTPPEIGHTYWVRLVARKDANSFMYSDEIASFEVPAIRLDGALWYMPSGDDPSRDYATVVYNLYDTDPEARLYCYWSENRADLEGDEAPSGSSVRFLDLGTGRQRSDEFSIPASEGLERGKVYYIRLATGNESGTKYFLSKLIVTFETVDKPRVVFPEAVWAQHSATVKFRFSTAHLPPESVDLLALYSGVEADMKKASPFGLPGVEAVDLGRCSLYPDDIETSTRFPLWSPVNTNFWVRLALATNGVPVCYSQRTQHLDLISAVPANTLLVFADAQPRTGCYGDEPLPPGFEVSYGGLTEGPGWDNWTNVLASTLSGSPSCDVTSASPVGQYDIGRGTITEYFPTYHDADSDVYYYYELVFTGAKYTVTNAHFTASVDDFAAVYTGAAPDLSGISRSESGIVNGQPVSYLWREGTNDWSAALSEATADVSTHPVQFKASAPNHEDVVGTFTVTVLPAPLFAEISAGDLNYLGVPQSPAVSTNVTGLVRPDLNPLACEFRDESGEWMAEVPQFTAPGVYKLFFRASAPNHAAFTTNCTFQVEEWDYMVNMDGATGYATPIRVGDPGWLLRATGWTGERFAVREDRFAKLDETCENGLKLWQNYMIDRTDLGKKLVAAVRQSGDRVNADSFVVHFPNVEVLRNAGLSVGFRLDRKLRGESGFTPGEVTDKYETNVPLGPHDPTGLYVFNIVLSPADPLLSGSAVLSSVATVGVLRVTSALTNTVAAVPWMSMASDEARDENVLVRDAVNPNGVSAGDMIVAHDPASGDFNGWTHAGGNAWNALATVSPEGVSVRAAEATGLAPGGAFWLVRSDPAASPSVYLVGRHVGGTRTVEIAPGTAAAPGSTLCANPTGNAIPLDGLGFEGTVDRSDTIVFAGNGAVQTTYVRDASNTAWGVWRPTRVGRKIVNVFVPGGEVAPGTGFWYVRRSQEPLSLEWPAWSAD